MRSLFAFFAEGFARKLWVVTDAVARFFFPTEEATFGVLAAAHTLCRVADVIVRKAGIAASHAAGETFFAADGAVLVRTFRTAALMAGAGGRRIVIGNRTERAITTAHRLLRTFRTKGASAAFGNLTTG